MNNSLPYGTLPASAGNVAYGPFVILYFNNKKTPLLGFSMCQTFANYAVC